MKNVVAIAQHSVKIKKRCPNYSGGEGIPELLGVTMWEQKSC